MPTRSKPQRLIDLHVDWLLQYSAEITCFESALYGGISHRLDQAEGYLGATSAAILSCYRRADDWATQPDVWEALGVLVTRYEAEFPGRLLLGPDDLARWRDDHNGLTWGVLGVEGFDALIRTTTDLDRLPDLFRRGVRLFQPVYSTSSMLAGSSRHGDDRGVTSLGLDFLHRLFEIVGPGAGPRALLDLAHLNPRSVLDVLRWFEADPDRPQRLIPVYSHGSIATTDAGSALNPRALAMEAVTRLRAMGGTIGLTPAYYPDVADLAAALESVAEVPYLGQAGFEGIGIGTDFLGVDHNPPGLTNASEVVAWLTDRFTPPTSHALIRGSAANLLERLTGTSRTEGRRSDCDCQAEA